MKKLLQIILFMLLVALVCTVNAQGFITTWKTDNPGTSGTNQLTIPTNALAYDYDYNIYWEDVNNPSVNGIVSNITFGDYTITFPSIGTYRVEITGLFPSIFFNSSGDKDKILSIEQWGSNQWMSFDQAFQGCTNLVLNAADVPDLSMVTNMVEMFKNATNFTGDLSSWNVSNVQNISAMFADAESFNSDLSNWDVSNVVSMASLFSNADSFDSDLSSWDVSKVTNMFGMFGYSPFDGDLSSWEVSNVTNMGNMFIYGGLSISNYDKLLIEWSKLPLQNGNNFNAGNSTYSILSASARQKIFDDFGWTITDGGLAPIAEEDYFITTWDIPAGHNLVIPTGGGANITDYNCAIDWGDGSALEVFTGDDPDPSHMYAGAGTYTIKIAGTFPYIVFNNGGDKDKILNIGQWGNISWESFRLSFYGCSNLTSTANDTPNLSKVTNMEAMFRNAGSFNADLSDWNVSSIVADMSNMFDGANSFNSDLSGWDVSGVTDMSQMFRYAGSFNGDISNWNVSGVGYMYGMFWSASSFNGDISKWNVSGVSQMQQMFFDAKSFNGDISKWDVSSVVSMANMFMNAKSFNSDVSGWDVSGVTDMSQMFSFAGLSIKNYDKLLNSWSTQTLQNGVSFHAGSSNYSLLGEAARQKIITDFGWTITDGGLASIPEEYYFITTWDFPASYNLMIPTNGGVDISDYNCVIDWGDGSESETFTGDDPDPSHNYSNTGTYTIKIAGSFPWFQFGGTTYAQNMKSIEQWGTIAWENMEGAFQGCSNLIYNANDIPNLNGVTSMKEMFSNASLFNGNINNWDVSNVTDMELLFNYAQNFDQNLNSWNTSNVTNMHGMFTKAESFNGNISGWDVSNVNDMSNMFFNAPQFNQDLSGWNTSSVTDMSLMFSSNGSAFNGDIGGWNVTQVMSMENMFFGTHIISTDLYDQLLIAWSQQALQNGVLFHSGSSHYTIKAAEARQKLIDDFGWTITDGGQVFYDPKIETSGSTSFDENASGVVIDVNAIDGYGGISDENITYSFSGQEEDEAYFDINISTGEISFLTAPDFENPADNDANNIYTIGVVATNQTSNSDTQTIGITVNDLNDNTPVITSESSKNVFENASGIMYILADDQDAGTTLVFSINGGADQTLFNIDSSTGFLEFTITPDYENPSDENMNNNYEVQIKVSDGTNELAQDLIISVFNENEDPTIANAISDQNLNEGFTTYAIDLSSVFTDPDGDALNYEVTGNTATGVVTTSISGSTLTLTEVGVGTATITVTANDGNGGSVNDEFVVSVNSAANNAPTVANAISDQNLDEGFATQAIDLTNVFTDSDGDELGYEVTSNTATNVVTTSISGNTLTLTEVGVGTATISVTANDGNGGSVNDEFVVSVNAAANNIPTVANAISDQNLDEGFATQAIDLTNVFTDADGDVLSYEVTGNTPSSIVMTSIVGSVLTLTEAGTGSALITVTAADGNGGEVSTDFNVNVNPASNTVPTVSNVTFTGTLTIGNQLTGSYTFNDADGDADNSTYQWYRSDDNASTNKSAIAGATTVTYTLTTSDETKHISFEVTPNDGFVSGESVESALQGPVPASNTAPTVANAISDQNLDEGFSPVEIDLSSVFTDADADALSYEVTGNTATGVVTTSISGSTLTLTEVGVGTATITVSANDGNGGSVNEEFIVTVNDVLGLSEEEILLVYPNPVNGVLTIELPDNTIKIGLYNSLGQKVIAIDPVPGSDRLEMNVEELGSGHYMLIIDTKVKQINKNVIKR